MAAYVTQLPVTIRPDPSRTVVRPFDLQDSAKFAVEGHTRAQRIVDRVMALDPDALREERKTVVDSLDERHRDVDALLMRRFEALEGLTLDRSKVDRDHALLIGAYFTEEFSYEAAALFNPSATPHPDQSGLAEGDTRFLFSLRGIGEGHVSSLTFRTGVWSADGSVAVDEPSRFAVGPTITSRRGRRGPDGRLTWPATASHDISETVIFPFLPSQGRGIEDVRLVHFTEDDGTARPAAAPSPPSTARTCARALLQTPRLPQLRDARRASARSRDQGHGAVPAPDRRPLLHARAPGQREHLAVVHPTTSTTGTAARSCLTPRYPWEFVQIGNCGSPIEIDEGWLVLTHGVGMVRNYCVGACLLDKDDPSKVLARLTRAAAASRATASATAMCPTSSTAAARCCAGASCCCPTAWPTPTPPSPPSTSTRCWRSMG